MNNIKLKSSDLEDIKEINIVLLGYSQASRGFQKNFKNIGVNSYIVSKGQHEGSYGWETLPIELNNIDYVIFGGTNDQISNYAGNIPNNLKNKLITIQNGFDLLERRSQYDVIPKGHIVLTCAIKKDLLGAISINQFSPCPTIGIAQDLAQDLKGYKDQEIKFSLEPEAIANRNMITKCIVNSIVNTSCVAYNEFAKGEPKNSLLKIGDISIQKILDEILYVLEKVFVGSNDIPNSHEINEMLQRTAFSKFSKEKPSLWYDFYDRSVSIEKSEYKDLLGYVIKKAEQLGVDIPYIIYLHKKFIYSLRNIDPFYNDKYTMQRFLTGLTPSSDQIHLGNYFGALKPMIELQKEKGDSAEFYLFLSNLHALTKENRNPNHLKQNSMNLIKLYIACGIDPNKFFIYKQSDIPAHSELCWIFECLTSMGFMERMHVYKDAMNKGKSNELSVGSFCYPILMAVDIILYDVSYVPVGKDQKQHVEYARDITEKFNNQFGDTFMLPESYIQESNGVIPGIDGRKMSKSYDNYIGLLDEDKVIEKKIKKIPTNALPIESPKNPDECNLYKIYKLFLSEIEEKKLRERYLAGGLGYGELKNELTKRVIEFITPIRKKFNSISDEEIELMLKNNAIIANEIANKKLKQVHEKIGF